MHVCQVSRKEVFPCQHITSWQMIYSLVGLHFEQERGENGTVYPPDVPVFFLVSRQTEICFVGTILQNLILCIQDVYHERPLILVDLIGISLLPHKFTTLIIHSLHFLSVIGRGWCGRLTKFCLDFPVLGQINRILLGTLLGVFLLLPFSLLLLFKQL